MATTAINSRPSVRRRPTCTSRRRWRIISSVARWGAPGMKVSWQVTGVRRDAFAQANPLAVEVEKPANERGFYINPALYGQPEEKQIEWGRFPAKMRLLKQKRVAPSNLASVKK